MDGERRVVWISCLWKGSWHYVTLSEVGGMRDWRGDLSCKCYVEMLDKYDL